MKHGWGIEIGGVKTILFFFSVSDSSPLGIAQNVTDLPRGVCICLLL